MRRVITAQFNVRTKTGQVMKLGKIHNCVDAASKSPASAEKIEGPAIFEMSDGDRVYSLGGGKFMIVVTGEMLTRD